MERGGEMKELSLVNDSLLKQRLTELDSSWTPNILSGLERFIRTAGDYDLFRVNPIKYATANGLSEAEGIELFVHAAKVGLFEMAAHLRLLPAGRRQFSRARPGSSTFPVRVLQRAQRCGA
jgi:hypothetical protein